MITMSYQFMCPNQVNMIIYILTCRCDSQIICVAIKKKYKEDKANAKDAYLCERHRP